ncbi:MAG: hypothetical protein AAGA30_08325, partial [Planctomycetota bacterium]
MSTQVKSTSAAENSGVNRVDEYVSRQLTKTTQQVRISDIATGLLTLATYVLTFFLIAALIDAWIWPFSTLARLLALGIFLTGLGAVCWLSIFPILFKRINPQYAAKMIEEAKPSFKNSLLNYLYLKKEDHRPHKAILREVSRKAATDLSTISPDAAVDKSNLIRVGFLLVALVATCIGYSILSPKNPFSTVRRVLAPAAKIGKPAAVTIDQVTPGDTSVFFGDRLEVRARVRGAINEQAVKLVYTTEDSQTVGAPIEMSYTGSEGIYVGELATGPTGIQQPLAYRIEAGDGRTPDFSVSVRPNPTISVKSIRVTPPSYTKLPERIIEGTGEIQAAEGSYVEITAVANLPIQLAYIVPLVAKNNNAAQPNYREMRSISMRTDNQEAIGGLTAALNSNRDQSQFTHYKIKFRSTEDHANERPNVYPIRVIADLAPEIEISQPKQLEVTVPENQSLPIEIWAADLDYQLTAIDMFVEHKGSQILKTNLFKKQIGNEANDRVNVRSEILPTELGLKSGDQVILYATASDNRISPSSELPDPNVTKTENYTLVITDPVEEPENQDSQGDSTTEEDEKESEEDSDRQDPESNSEANQPDSDSNEENRPRDEAGNDQESGQSSNDQQDSEDSTESADQNKDQEGSDSSSGNDEGSRQPSSSENSEANSDPSSDESSQNEGSSSSSSDEGDSKQSQSGSGSETESGNNQEAQTRDGGNGKLQGSQEDQENSGNTNSKAGQENGNTTRDGSSGSQSDSTNGNGESEGEEFRDESLTDGDKEPLRENASESEQFERLKEYFEEQQENNDSSESSQPGSQENNPSQSDSNNPSQSDSNNTNSENGSESNQRPPEPQERDGGESEDSSSNKAVDQPEQNGSNEPNSSEGAGDEKSPRSTSTENNQAEPNQSESSDLQDAQSQPSPPSGQGDQGNQNDKSGSSTGDSSESSSSSEENKSGSESSESQASEQSSGQNSESSSENNSENSDSQSESGSGSQGNEAKSESSNQPSEGSESSGGNGEQQSENKGESSSQS